MLDLRILGSSSHGNCYLLYAGSEVLLLECGIQAKKIIYGLNFRVDNVVGALCSHEHGDHSKSVKDVMKAGIDVYASEGTFSALGVEGHRVKKLKALEQVQIGGFTVLPFDVQHDAREPLGFLIQHEAIGKLLFATDTYYIKYKFPELNYIMVECNYSKSILEKNIQAGTLSKALRNRLLKSHFSLENVKEFLKANDLKKVENILLMHLSDGNSNAGEFQEEIEKLTGIPVKIC
ncbi:MAG TPA: MBL fold metallo-hydrolase [Ignavibacteriales bacterium]|nr:MBL fold metallo-hydrolase [Ignavibacteriales bacterium]